MSFSLRFSLFIFPIYSSNLLSLIFSHLIRTPARVQRLFNTSYVLNNFLSAFLLESQRKEHGEKESGLVYLSSYERVCGYKFFTKQNRQRWDKQACAVKGVEKEP